MDKCFPQVIIFSHTKDRAGLQSNEAKNNRTRQKKYFSISEIQVIDVEGTQ